MDLAYSIVAVIDRIGFFISDCNPTSCKLDAAALDLLSPKSLNL